MPPRKYKVNHHAGASGGKHVPSFEDVQARNRDQESARYAPKGAARQDGGWQRGGAVAQQESGGSESDDSPQPFKKTAAASQMEVSNPNAVRRNEEKEGVELTRRHREEIEKAAARRRYEEKHRAGQTEEAKADLARLEVVRKRREEAAAKKRQEEEQPKKAVGEVGAGDGKEPRGALVKEPVEEGKTREEDAVGDAKDSWQSKLATVSGEDAGNTNANTGDGSIENCREIEEDFM